jgi:hypothetical protein
MDAYREVLRKHPIVTTFAFYETQPTPLIKFTPALGIFVSPESADPGVTNYERLEVTGANHFQLCMEPFVSQAKDRIQEEVERAAGKRPVFGMVERWFPEDNDIKDLCSGRSFIDIPAYKRVKQTRREAEDSLRNKLRQLIREDKLVLSEHQIENLEPKAELDRFVQEMWYETKLLKTLQDLRSIAQRQQKDWPNEEDWANKEDWPSLILFYRSLRTIEHTYAMDFLPAHTGASRRTDREELLALVTRAYDTLEKRCKIDKNRETKPDKDGSTRTLLLRMECALKALDVAMKFIDYPDRPEDEETPEVAKTRRAKRELFQEILKKFEESLL